MLRPIILQIYLRCHCLCETFPNYPPKLWVPRDKDSTAPCNNHTSSHYWIFILYSRHSAKCFPWIGSCSPSTVFWDWSTFSLCHWENWSAGILVTFPSSDSRKWFPNSQAHSTLHHHVTLRPWGLGARWSRSLMYSPSGNGIEIDFLCVHNIPLDSKLLESKDPFLVVVWHLA